MYRREIFRCFGVCSTVLFVSSAAFLLVLGLRQAGIKWWVIFSLSGHSAVLLFMAASLYAFAVFRSILGNQKIRREHPLTSLGNYMTFYNMSPLLGGFIGAILGLGRTDLLERGISLAFGCLSTTFFVWVVLDPFLGFVEMLLPSCRRYRSERLSAEKTEAQRRKAENRRMLYDLAERELEQEQLRRAKLVPISEDLAGLLAALYKGQLFEKLRLNGKKVSSRDIAESVTETLDGTTETDKDGTADDVTVTVDEDATASVTTDDDSDVLAYEFSKDFPEIKLHEKLYEAEIAKLIANQDIDTETVLVEYRDI